MLTTKRMVARAGVAAIALLMQLVPAHAFTASDRSAAIVVYPKIVVDTSVPTDTVITLVNTSRQNTARAHCFYVNANSHCSNNGQFCRSSVECSGLGTCIPGWSEVDFYVNLTVDQPLYWVASVGRNSVCAGTTCDPLPIQGGLGVCTSGIFAGGFCRNDEECGASPGSGVCSGAGDSGNAGTSIPPVGDDPFIGELKCVQINDDGSPATRDYSGRILGANDLAGTATLTSVVTVPDAQSYNAIGIGTNECVDGPRAGLPCKPVEITPGNGLDVDGECPAGFCNLTVDGDSRLVLGGPSGPREYQSCPSTLILDHVFDGAVDPINSAPNPLTTSPATTFVTSLTLVPCSEDFLLGSSNIGRSTAQYLVFNEFEQRYSSSRPVNCFDEVLLSNIDTRNNSRSIFSASVSGTIAGQTRITAVGSGLLGVARAMKATFPPTIPGPVVIGPGSAYNLHQQGVRDDDGEQDTIVLP